MSSFAGSGISLGTLWVTIAASVDEAISQFQKFGEQTSKIIDEQKKKWEDLADVGKNLQGIGAALSVGVTAPLVGLAAASVKAAASMDSLRLGLQAVEGGAEAAGKALDDLKEIAKLPGLNLKEATEGYIRLRAVGTSAEDAKKQLSAFGNALATVGKGSADLNGVITQLVQMSAKTKVVAEDLKPVMERVPQVAKILQEAYGTIDTEQLQKAGKTTQEVINTIIAGLQKLPPVSGGLANSFENLGDSIDQTLSKIGDVLKPVVIKILDVINGLIDKLQGLIQWFAGLPQPAQTAAIAIAAVAAAAGPLIVILGTLLTSVGQITGAIGLLTAAIGSEGLVAALAAAGPLAIAFGAAIAAWEIAQEWQALQKFNAEMAILEASLNNGGKATAAQATEIALLQHMLDQAGVAYDNNATSAAQLITKLRDLVKQHKELTAGIVTVIDPLQAQQKLLNDTAKAAEDLGIQLKEKLTKAVTDAAAKVELFRQAVAAGVRPPEDLAAAINQLTIAQANLARGDKDLADARKKAADDAKKAADQRQKDYEAEVKAENELFTARAKVAKGEEDQIKIGQAYGKAQAKLNEELQKLATNAANFSNLIAPIPGELNPVVNALDELAKLFPKAAPPPETLNRIEQYRADLAALGLVYHDVNKEADDAIERYNRMVQAQKDGIGTAEQVEEANLAMWEALQAEAIATEGVYNEVFAKEIEAAKQALDQIRGATAAHHKQTQSMWQQWGRQIQQTIGNFASDIFKRLFEGDDTNAQLDKQAADLQKSLSDRAAEYAKSEADIAQKQADAAATYQADLDAENAAYEKSLADKQADFDKFAADNNAAQAKLDADYQDELAKTTKDYEDSLADKQADYDKYAADAIQKEADKEKDLAQNYADDRKALQDSLDKETLDYDRFVSDTTDKIAEIRRSSQEDLDKDLRNLQQSLDDKRQEYADYVDDANRSLSRIGEDHADNIEQETKDTQQNIDERTKDYKRYLADTTTQLQKIRKKHGGVYSQEEADLQQSLDRQTEDYNDYVAEQQGNLKDFVTAEQKKQQQEEEDLKTSLERRARDQAEYETQIQTQRAETVAQHAEDQTREIADQQQALARKTEDFDKFQADIAGKQAAADQQYQDDLDQSRADLQQNLADKKSDLDQFNTDAKTKYDEDVANLKANYGEDKGNLEQELKDKIADLQQFNSDAKQKHDENLANIKSTYDDSTADLIQSHKDQLAEYDQFISDTNAKLEEIRQAHKTLWGDIAGFGVSALESIGAALVTLAASEAVKKLGQILDIGGAAASTAGSVASGAGSAGGGAASGVGGAVAGGLTGWLGAIGSIGSMISGFIGNFQQAETNKTLDKVVLHTLQTANDMANLRRDEWDRWGGWQLIKDDIINRLNTIMDNSNLSVLKFDDMIRPLQAISDASQWAAASLDRMAGGADDDGSESLLGRIQSELIHANADLDALVLQTGYQRVFSVNLYGTDPTAVSARLGQQLRLQGAQA